MPYSGTSLFLSLFLLVSLSPFEVGIEMAACPDRKCCLVCGWFRAFCCRAGYKWFCFLRGGSGWPCGPSR